MMISAEKLRLVLTSREANALYNELEIARREVGFEWPGTMLAELFDKLAAMGIDGTG